jgi:hypothetical protein
MALFQAPFFYSQFVDKFMMNVDEQALEYEAMINKVLISTVLLMNQGFLWIKIFTRQSRNVL